MEDYLKLLRKIYDFNALSALLRRPDFKFAFDGMHGVAGPYAKRIFVQVRLPASTSAPCPTIPKRSVLPYRMQSRNGPDSTFFLPEKDKRKSMSFIANGYLARFKAIFPRPKSSCGLPHGKEQHWRQAEGRNS